MASKFYVVWQGRETGIFNDWNTCQRQVDKFAGAKFKAYPTLEEAKTAFNENSEKSIKKENLSDTSSSKKVASQALKSFNAEEIAAMRVDTKIFSDGGCEPNPGEAGSGVAVYRNNVVAELWYGLYNPEGTNNTAELNALNQALLIAKNEIDTGKSVVIFCDSQYSIQCITQWADNWEKKGWKKKGKGGEIKNLELIKEMFTSYKLLQGRVQILHVNGHIGVEGNELADRMSMIAIESEDTDFTLFREDLDIQAILSMRAG